MEPMPLTYVLVEKQLQAIAAQWPDLKGLTDSVRDTIPNRLRGSLDPVSADVKQALYGVIEKLPWPIPCVFAGSDCWPTSLWWRLLTWALADRLLLAIGERWVELRPNAEAVRSSIPPGLRTSTELVTPEVKAAFDAVVGRIALDVPDCVFAADDCWAVWGAKADAPLR